MKTYLDLTPGEEFYYNGPARAWIQNPISHEFDFDRMYENIEVGGIFMVEEFHPYEPSAYVHSACVSVFWSCDGDMGIEFTIDVGDILNFYGICDDCGGRHESNYAKCPVMQDLMVD